MNSTRDKKILWIVNTHICTNDQRHNVHARGLCVYKTWDPTPYKVDPPLAGGGGGGDVYRMREGNLFTEEKEMWTGKPLVGSNKPITGNLARSIAGSILILMVISYGHINTKMLILLTYFYVYYIKHTL